MEITYSRRRISWYRVGIGASVSVKGAYSGAHGAAVRVVSAECDEWKWAIRPKFGFILVHTRPKVRPKMAEIRGVPAIKEPGNMPQTL